MNVKPKETIGDRIRFLREHAGLSRSALARIAYVSRSTVSRWECDEIAPRIQDVARISAIFDVSCDYIITGNRK